MGNLICKSYYKYLTPLRLHKKYFGKDLFDILDPPTFPRQ